MRAQTLTLKYSTGIQRDSTNQRGAGVVRRKVVVAPDAGCSRAK